MRPEWRDPLSRDIICRRPPGGRESGVWGNREKRGALMEIQMDSVYRRSQAVVAREIEGELIIVPVAAGVAQGDEELFSLNESGRAIWSRLDGERTLRRVAELLEEEYEAPAADIERDIKAFVQELLGRRMLEERPAPSAR
jgi:hypothetical protein